MAGAKVEIRIEDAKVLAALEAGQNVLGGNGLRGLLADIGEYMLRATRERAARQVDPDGHAWRELEPSYKRWKEKKRPGVPILKFDNHMLGDQLSYQVDGDAVLIGTNAIYGAIHQFGGTIKHAAYGRLKDHAIIPKHQVTVSARPFLGVSTADAEEITQITLDHIKAAIEGGEPPEQPAA